MRSCTFGLQICRRKVRRIQVEITIGSIRLDASDGRVANRITPKKKENNSAEHKKAYYIKVIFNTNINRTVSYYTGMTFNIEVKTNGKKEVFLSGGRFDNLIKDLGNRKDLNAVGAAINRSIL